MTVTLKLTPEQALATIETLEARVMRESDPPSALVGALREINAQHPTAGRAITFDQPMLLVHGERVTMDDFCAANDEDEETIEAVQALMPGESVTFGGGAFGTTVVERLS